jgi:predicted nucleic acid-binding protein
MTRNAEVYLDASMLVALLTNDPLTPRADAFMRAKTPALIVSDFAAAEFASAMARRVRTGGITPDEARVAFSTFDAWAARATRREQTKRRTYPQQRRFCGGSTSIFERQTRSISRSHKG